MKRQSLSTRLNAKQREDRYWAYVNSIHEPFPSNPLRKARISRNETLQSLADKCGLSKQTLIRSEQGLFEEPPVKLVTYLVSDGANELQLRDDYEGFVLGVRSRHKRMFGEFNKTVREAGQHPLTWLLSNWIVGEPMNVTEMAKLLCLSQAQLSHWLNNPKQVKVPSPLLTALFQSGYAKFELESLVTEYAKYRTEIGVN